MFTGCGPERASDKPQAANRLALAESPYLRQHADNPVQWYEWGPDALEKAKLENKPLVISIGYASCHWCHVMEEESFLDSTVARIMNEHFVPIKVDREERPDLDQIYISAAELISGKAGWPLNAFALPDGRPFFAGTYYPKEQWISLLRQVVDSFAAERTAIEKQARDLTKGIAAQDELGYSTEDDAQDIAVTTFTRICADWTTGMDSVYGGLQADQKFPMPSLLEFGLQHYFLTGDLKSLNTVTRSLDHMAYGGIYDQLGGGFSRYTTDVGWREPHFEKMLYDNAQLVSLYAHAFQLTKNPLYGEVVSETLEFIRRELTSSDGGFYSSLNADTEGEEGKFYVWPKSEINSLLDSEAAEFVCRYYNVSEAGNWSDGKNILFRDYPRKGGIDSIRENETLFRMLQRAKRKLFHARELRSRPATDKKVLTSWNALMISGYVDAYRAFGRDEYLNTALKAANFLDEKLTRNDGGLWRSLYGEGRGIEGLLDDYAYLARAYLSLYEVTFDTAWLERARGLADFALEHFYDPHTGMVFYTSDRVSELAVRMVDIADQALPSSGSVLADVLFRLGTYYQADDYTASARESAGLMFSQRVATALHFHANWARLVGVWMVHHPFEVAVTGPDAREMSLLIQREYHPLAIHLGGNTAALPLLKDKHIEGQNIIYVCRDRVCKLPVRHVSEALRQLRNDVHYKGDARLPVEAPGAR